MGGGQQPVPGTNSRLPAPHTSRGLYLLRVQGRSSQWLPRQAAILRAAQEPFPPRPRLRGTEIVSGGTGHRRCTPAVPGSPRRPELSHALPTCLIGGAKTPPSSRLDKPLGTSPPTSVTGGEAPLSARPSTETGGAQLVSYPRIQAADFSESAPPGKGNETIACRGAQDSIEGVGLAFRHFRIGREEPR